MPKRMIPDDDDEVEIVSTSFDIPRTGSASAGSSSNPYMLDFDSPQKTKARATKPRTEKQTVALPTTNLSIAAPDSHPYSYPAKPAPPVSHGRATNLDAPPPAKKQRKKKADPNAPVPEKRGAMFKKACPKNVLDRVDRVMSQRCVLWPTRLITICH